jgi:hypothetical protein
MLRLLTLLLLAVLPASAHVADHGMDYTRFHDINGRPCCDHTDCRPADDFAEAPERGVVRLLIEGQWVDVPRAHVTVERARDGRAHWCGGRLFTNSHLGWLPFVWCVILPARES